MLYVIFLASAVLADGDNAAPSCKKSEKTHRATDLIFMRTDTNKIAFARQGDKDEKVADKTGEGETYSIRNPYTGYYRNCPDTQDGQLSPTEACFLQDDPMNFDKDSGTCVTGTKRETFKNVELDPGEGQNIDRILKKEFGRGVSDKVLGRGGNWIDYFSEGSVLRKKMIVDDRLWQDKPEDNLESDDVSRYTTRDHAIHVNLYLIKLDKKNPKDHTIIKAIEVGDREFVPCAEATDQTKNYHAHQINFLKACAGGEAVSEAKAPSEKVPSDAASDDAPAEKRTSPKKAKKKKASSSGVELAGDVPEEMETTMKAQMLSEVEADEDRRWKQGEEGTYEEEDGETGEENGLERKDGSTERPPIARRVPKSRS